MWLGLFHLVGGNRAKSDSSIVAESCSVSMWIRIRRSTILVWGIALRITLHQISSCYLNVTYFPVAIAEGQHLFPFRTEQLSPPAPMVLLGALGGRVGRCRFIEKVHPIFWVDLFLILRRFWKYWSSSPLVFLYLGDLDFFQPFLRKHQTKSENLDSAHIVSLRLARWKYHGLKPAKWVANSTEGCG